MFDDFDKREKRQQKLIRQHCAALSKTLNGVSSCDPDAYKTLGHQQDVLAALLDAYMKSIVAKAQDRGSFNADHIALALRIQKQCTETIKADAAIHYMRHLRAGSLGENGTARALETLPPLPHAHPLPDKNEEQSDEAE